VSDEGSATPVPTARRSAGPLVAAAVWLVGTVVAFLLLDWIVALFASILGLTLVGVAFLASDWVRSSTFEEREAERANRRQAKWDAKADVRARDRARWEAHQARKAAGTDGS
jgi:hypothetical protein